MRLVTHTSRTTLYFSKIKTTQIELLYTISTSVNVKVSKKNQIEVSKKNYTFTIIRKSIMVKKNYLIPKKTTQVMYS